MIMNGGEGGGESYGQSVAFKMSNGGGLNNEVENLKIFTLEKASGRITHHFMVRVYKFNRRKVKPSGITYFYCNEKGCNACITATYAENNFEPINARLINNLHCTAIFLMYANNIFTYVRRT